MLGLTFRPELFVSAIGAAAFRPLRARFSDVLEPTDRFPDFHAKHPDDAVACLSLLFCMRRYRSPDDPTIEVVGHSSKA